MADIDEDSTSDSGHSRHELQSLDAMIRYGWHPDDPQLLSVFINRALNGKEVSRLEQWQNVIQCSQLLLEAYADTLNQAHWRSACLNNLHWLLSLIEPLATDKHQQSELKELAWEAQVTGYYFDPYAKEGSDEYKN